MGNLAAARSNVVTAARLSPPPEIELFDLRVEGRKKKKEKIGKKFNSWKNVRVFFRRVNFSRKS